MNLGERLKTVREYLKADKKITQIEFAKIISVNEKTLRGYEANKTPIGADAIEILIKDFNLNPNWFFTGQGEIFLKDNSSTPRQEDLRPEIQDLLKDLKQATDKVINLNKLIYTPTLQTTSAVREDKTDYTTPPVPPWVDDQAADDYEPTHYPLIDGLVACGTPSALTEDQIIDHIPLPSCFNVQADFVIKTRGDSMLEYGIAPGMLIFVRKQSTVEHGNLVLLAVYEADSAQPILKKVKQQTNGAIVFINGKNETMVPGDNMEVIGVVTFCMQDFRDQVE